ncbi:hypothetical protein PARHAE_00706 [Paracoccus haematequi]|uniref:Uncharacterized protein n=1 Tax=Paracoccus haematequi TaxID=2491866 RepID=A0A447IJ74_9RHOB|nr:hypothetical protein [Paracoccus haematequi]VDS07529.1 hypothetical protein PARHAE_00706 [Paracoccus haematequi]
MTGPTDAPKIDTQAPGIGMTTGIDFGTGKDTTMLTLMIDGKLDHASADGPWGQAIIALLAERDLSAAREAAAKLVLTEKLYEMTRRRDEWKRKAEGCDELAAAVRAGINDAGERNLSRVFLRGTLVDSERRLKDAEDRAAAREAAAVRKMREALLPTIKANCRICGGSGYSGGSGGTGNATTTLYPCGHGVLNIPLPDASALDRLLEAARQDERTAIASYIGMSPSEVTDRQYHMEAIRTGRYRDDPLMQRGGWMEGGDG